MYQHYPGGFYYIFIYSITWELLPFLWFFHENKVWYWALFVITPLPVRIETATLASYPSASKDLVLVLIGSGISPLQHHALMSTDFLYTM